MTQQILKRGKHFVFLFVTLLFTFCFLTLPPLVSAHVLESSGSIGAVLHIDPEDDPIVGQQASFFFEFKDKQNKFNPANCTCTFSFLENGKKIFSQPLFQSNTDSSLTTASVFYTFTQKDVYQVKVSGRPLMEKKAFEPFTLTYAIRVSREINNSANTSVSSTNWLNRNGLLIGITVIAIIIVITIILRKRKAR